MSKKLFTNKEISILTQDKYVEKLVAKELHIQMNLKENL